MTTPSPPATIARPDTARARPDEHYDALDGVRAIAAFGVLVFHVAADTGNTLKQDATAWLFSGGAIAVPIFFTLSGLLLYRPWVVHLLHVDGRRVRVGAYLWRRAVRILPAYWLVVAYVMVVILTSHLGDGWTWLKLLTLTYTYEAHPWWGSILGPQGLGQIWSLTVEVFWYAVLPLTAALFGGYARFREPGLPDPDRRARRLLTAIGAYAVATFVFTVFLFHPRYAPQLGVWLPRYFAWFAIGMALAVVSVRARAGSPGAARFARTVAHSWGTCWAIAAVLFCIAASPLTGPSDLVTVDTIWTSELRILLYGSVAAFAVAPVALAPAGAPVMRAILGNRVMRFLGRISYGVFLWQVAVSVGWYDLTGHEPFTGHFLVEFPVIAALTVVIATASFYLVERPVLRLASRRWRSG
ncbi:acyltransferase [Actinomadura sp. DC4]|uniref:acyltransferase family protein n=1 Tax=Actinomadura sp. DC4 TaxID=3055069 RepID=UPI0025B0EC63|nr:acyltransferase [Actinomadura sp. DC4]MDN3355673.1 acyltransferase [Actinomadura sp. DC4]